MKRYSSCLPLPVEVSYNVYKLYNNLPSLSLLPETGTVGRHRNCYLTIKTQNNIKHCFKNQDYSNEVQCIITLERSNTDSEPIFDLQFLQKDFLGVRVLSRSSHTSHTEQISVLEVL